MSTLRHPAWLERTAPEIRTVGWSRSDTAASPHEPGDLEGATVVDEAMLSAAIDARRLAESELSRVRAELALARAAAAESERIAVLATARAEAANAELSAATAAMEARSNDLAACAEHEVVRLALAVAERVVGREVEREPALVVAWAREAIRGSELGEALGITVSPDLASNIEREAWGDLADRVSVDPELPRGTCELHDGARVVTLSEHSRLALVGASVADAGRREAA